MRSLERHLTDNEPRLAQFARVVDSLVRNNSYLERFIVCVSFGCGLGVIGSFVAGLLGEIIWGEWFAAMFVPIICPVFSVITGGIVYYKAYVSGRHRTTLKTTLK